MKLVLTGHRPNRLGGYSPDNPLRAWVVGELRRYLIMLNPSLVYCGMALGFDQWGAALCVELRIPFVAAIPFRTYSARWPVESREVFSSLVGKAESVHVVSSSTLISHAIAARLCLQRNVWMVDQLDPKGFDCVVACWDGNENGGTVSTVRYAEKKKIGVGRIDPRQAPGYTRKTAYVGKTF